MTSSSPGRRILSLLFSSSLPLLATALTACAAPSVPRALQAAEEPRATDGDLVKQPQAELTGSAVCGLRSVDQLVTTGYEQTHGRDAPGPVAPWVRAYSEARGIDLERLLAALFPAGAPTSRRGVRALISSSRHVTGSWTYVSSESGVLWELRRVELAGGAGEALLALTSEEPPGELIIDRFDAAWRLSLLSTDGRLLGDARFTTHIPHRVEGLWDVIATSLELSDGSPRVTVDYGHSGGGGPRDQVFQATFTVGCSPPVLALGDLQQTVDDCCEPER